MSTKVRDPYAESAERFAADTTNHQMTVLRDDGLYRHLRFKAPGTGFYWFDLVTWPGRLAFTGDMDGYVFARVTDMFEFFRTPGGFSINPDYWSEKVDGGRARCKAFSEDRFRKLVTEYADDDAEGDWPGLQAAVQAEILDDPDGEASYEDGARQMLNRFSYSPNGVREFQFESAWEWDLSDYTWSFLWACQAIVWGIAQYDDAHRAASKG